MKNLAIVAVIAATLAFMLPAHAFSPAFTAPTSFFGLVGLNFTNMIGMSNYNLRQRNPTHRRAGPVHGSGGYGRTHDAYGRSVSGNQWEGKSGGYPSDR